jgi:hypothetical protein
MDVKEIEKRYAKGYNLNTDSGMIQWQNDMEWLIEQAGKVEKAKETFDEILEWDNQKEVNKIVRDALKELNI